MEDKTIVLTYRKLLFTALAVWTVLVAVAALFYWNDQKNEIISLAKNTAKTALNKDLATRIWTISHGGVYVPIDRGTPPNPYLAHIPERDIQTPTGHQLTLMNSSYVLRQMIENYGSLYGEKTRISSIKPLNPANKADAWEEKALRYLQAHPSQSDFDELHEKETGTYVRMMIPMFVEKSCLKCHNPSENKIGSIRGGIDISVPLESFSGMMQQTIAHTYGWLALIWAIVSGGISAAFLILEKKTLQLRAKEIEKIENYQSMISLVIDLIDKRDSYTAGHSQRVSHYCEMIAKAMYQDESLVNKVKEAAVLHDVGKIAIPDSILLKPGQLTPVEKELINYHLMAGYELLSKVDMYKELAEIMRHHHERYDGYGYPDGLAAEAIPPLSRIMIVADAFDAMTTDRIYKARKSVDEALKEIERLKGTQFDPEVANAAITVLRQITINASDQFPKTAMEEERFAYYLKDQLTGLNNHWALESILNINQHTREFRFATVIALENLMNLNRRDGWHSGDILLEQFSALLKNLYNRHHIYRIFGDTFVILSSEFLDLSPESLNAVNLDKTEVTLRITAIHLIEDKIDSISKLEETISSQKRG